MFKLKFTSFSRRWIDQSQAFTLFFFSFLHLSLINNKALSVTSVLSSDLNECSKKTYYCDQSAFCTNTRGSYECTCSQGCVADGFACYRYASKMFFVSHLFLELLLLSAHWLLIPRFGKTFPTSTNRVWNTPPAFLEVDYHLSDVAIPHMYVLITIYELYLSKK